MSFIVGLEEIAKVCGSTAGIVSVHVSIGVTAMNYFATEAQKKKYLPGMCAGKLMGFALTEPDAGTDAAGVKTTAVKKDGKYILNGQKTFISTAGHNENYIIVAITGTNVVNGKERKEYSTFIVNKDAPGFSISKPYHKWECVVSLRQTYSWMMLKYPKKICLALRAMALKLLWDVWIQDVFPSPHRRSESLREPLMRQLIM